MKKMTTVIILIVLAVVLGSSIAFSAYAKKKGMSGGENGLVSGSAATATDTDAIASPTDTGMDVVVEENVVNGQPVEETVVEKPEETQAPKAASQTTTTTQKETITKKVAEAEKQKVSDSELMLLAKIVHAESRGESDTGQQAVANVVLNRVASSKFPNTISAVIYQKGQFTPASKGSFSSIQPNQRCIENARAVLNGKRILPADVLYFSCGSKGRTVYKKIGNQTFYK